MAVSKCLVKKAGNLKLDNFRLKYVTDNVAYCLLTLEKFL